MEMGTKTTTVTLTSPLRKFFSQSLHLPWSAGSWRSHPSFCPLPEPRGSQLGSTSFMATEGPWPPDLRTTLLEKWRMDTRRAFMFATAKFIRLNIQKMSFFNKSTIIQNKNNPNEKTEARKRPRWAFSAAPFQCYFICRLIDLLPLDCWLRILEVVQIIDWLIGWLTVLYQYRNQSINHT